MIKLLRFFKVLIILKVFKVVAKHIEIVRCTGAALNGQSSTVLSKQRVVVTHAASHQDAAKNADLFFRAASSEQENVKKWFF